MEASETSPSRMTFESADDETTGSTARWSLEDKSNRDKFKKVGSKARTKVKQLLRIRPARHPNEPRQEPLRDALAQSPAFNPDKLAEKRSFESKTIPEKASEVVHQAGRFIKHPAQTLKGETARQVATTDRPYLSREEEEEFLRAHNEKDVKYQNESSDSEDEESSERLEEVLTSMEDHRAQMSVAWITKRYLRRARVIRKGAIEYPSISAYKKNEVDGSYATVDWHKWLGHFLLWYTQDFTAQYVDDADGSSFDRRTLAIHAERIVMASGPWQAWLLDVRQIYRWEDPRRTARWFAFVVFLWLINRIITFGFCHVVFTVLRNRFAPKTIEHLRTSHDRTFNKNGKTSKISEMIAKHGETDWVDPLIDQLGPRLQVQLGDLADFLEILVSFYDWKMPRATAATLFFFFACILSGTLASTDFNMRVVTFISMITFFISRPIASLYPKYRHIVSPVKMMFWDVPTDVEWCLDYLQRHAVLPRKTLSTQRDGGLSTEKGDQETVNGEPIASKNDEGPLADSHDDGADLDLVSRRCKWNGHSGHLIASTEGLRFVRLFPKEESWTRSLSELAELTKVDEVSVGKLKLKRSLQINFVDGDIEVFHDLRRRDECFNIIIAYSGLRWERLDLRMRSETRRV